MFDYVLAERLKLTVAQVRAMANAEYLGWQAYYQVKPVLVRLALHHDH